MDEVTVRKDVLEVLKVHYTLFCTLMDQEELDDATKLRALKKLRQELKNKLPEVEEKLKGERQ